MRRYVRYLKRHLKLIFTFGAKTSGEKEKSIEEKKFALVAKFFCGHAYSIDLIRHILGTSEL